MMYSYNIVYIYSLIYVLYLLIQFVSFVTAYYLFDHIFCSYTIKKGNS